MHIMNFEDCSARNEYSDEDGCSAGAPPCLGRSMLLKRAVNGLATHFQRSRIKSYYLMELAMRSTQQFSITLPNEMADVVKAKVAAGEYATESEVIRDGLRTLLARDRAVETWLREQVVPASQALKADPGRARSAEQARERLATKRRGRTDAGKA